MDFEATCDDKAPPFPQEVIEFPSVIIDAKTFQTISEFESFVKPVHHPTLTPFCKTLTTITQDQVNGAPEFIKVFESHQAWLKENGLSLSGENWSFVSCGDWDLRTMLPTQLKATNITETIPRCYRRWINIKFPFSEFANRKPLGMDGMLNVFRIPLTGTHHRGIDDCRNIAKILVHLLKNGYQFKFTSQATKYPPLNLEVCLKGSNEKVRVTLNKRSVQALLSLGSATFKMRITKVYHLTKNEPILNDAQIENLHQNTQLQFS
uniref:Exonuclease domain-containing protein n=1 Tax=Arcella intermedia TaxID=1963864 RepID=A0A6B2LE73_9EUKA